MWITTGDWQTGTTRAAITGFMYDLGLRRDYKESEKQI